MLQEETGIGVLTGFDSTLDAPFESVEEMISPGTRAELVAAVGQALTDQEIADAEAANRPPREERPALTTTKLGKGFVFRVGIPGWVPRLARGDAEVGQLTRNIVDLLRRVRPKLRSPIR
jgi:hypothetical protein